MSTRALVLILATVVALPAPVWAGQQPDVTATRDLSGVWMARDPGPTFATAEPRMTPWAVDRFQQARPTLGPRATVEANDPTVACLPPGVPYVLTVGDLQPRKNHLGLLKAFEQVATLAPQRLDGPRNLARVAFQDGNLTQAVEYLQRCEAYERRPPAVDWDGVWTMQES